MDSSKPKANKDLYTGCKVCFDDSAPVIRPDTHEQGTAAIFPCNRLWDKADKIRVCFLNSIAGCSPPSWDTGHILALANNWSTQLPSSIPKEKRDNVPTFVQVMDPMQSDIRVWFQTNETSRSKIGTDARSIPKGSEKENATMFLNLCGTDSYNTHLVMHEFGHALGLGHEHQRAVFWDNIQNFLNMDAMKKFFNDHAISFQTDGASSGATPGWRSKKYDPDSIMHYWVDADWLQDEYNSAEKVNSNPDISDEEKEVLKGFLRRVGTVVDTLSPTDLASIAEAYSSESSSRDPHPLHVKLPPSILNTLDSTSYGMGGGVWKEIGLALNLDGDQLDRIEKSNRNERDCCQEMLAQWLYCSDNCYLDTFLEVLKLPNVNRFRHYEVVKTGVLKELKSDGYLTTEQYDLCMGRKIDHKPNSSHRGHGKGSSPIKKVKIHSQT